MKELYVNNVGKMLIDKKGFFIVDTSSMAGAIIKQSFFVDKWGALNIVSFVDADILDFSRYDMICDMFKREMAIFKESSKTNALVYFKVFVTESGLDEQTINTIMSSTIGSVYNKNAFVPIIIDIKSQTVIMANPRRDDALGLHKLFDESLHELENFNVMHDLGEAEKSMKREYGYIEAENPNRAFRPYASYIIIAINIIVFIVSLLLGGNNDLYVLVLLGAKVNPLIASGQYWRLITSAFLHVDILHIAFNMYALYNFGLITENIYGSRKFLFIYMLSALYGSTASFAFSPALSVGASGAIFGLMGALLYLGQKKPKIFSTSFGANILFVLILNIVFGFSSTGIDNFAHLGGLLGGYLASNTVGLKNESGITAKKILYLVLSIIILGAIFLIGMAKA